VSVQQVLIVETEKCGLRSNAVAWGAEDPSLYVHNKPGRTRPADVVGTHRPQLWPHNVAATEGSAPQGQQEAEVIQLTCCSPLTFSIGNSTAEALGFMALVAVFLICARNK
jgi:hypothetical protein